MPASTPTRTLRIIQTGSGDHVETVLLADGQAPVTSRFAFHLAERDRERLRWYLEDYLDHPFDPYPTIAAGVEAQMRDIGRDFFEKVF